MKLKIKVQRNGSIMLFITKYIPNAILSFSLKDFQLVNDLNFSSN